MKKIMAVYDADSRYADRLAEFVNQRSQVPFQVVAFTSLEKLKEFAAREKIDLLLAGSGVEKEQLDGIGRSSEGSNVLVSATGDSGTHDSRRQT